MMLNTPIKTSPSPMVSASPTTKVTRMAKMILKERSASHNVASTPAIIAAAISPARSVRVPNSSSDSGTSPVSRTRTPCSGVRSRPRAATRMAALAPAPGSKALKSSRGLTSMKRRISSGLGGLPVIRARQER